MRTVAAVVTILAAVALAGWLALSACSPARRAAPAAAVAATPPVAVGNAAGPSAATADEGSEPAGADEPQTSANARAGAAVGAGPLDDDTLDDADATAEPFTSMPAAATIDFDREVRPILDARCQPCHFAGGKMHDRLPFDRPETIRTLGTRLFTRIKDADEQALIRAFLDQDPADGFDRDDTVIHFR